jgi:hypothetical protein
VICCILFSVVHEIEVHCCENYSLHILYGSLSHSERKYQDLKKKFYVDAIGIFLLPNLELIPDLHFPHNGNELLG